MTPSAAEGRARPEETTVYWRPGCGSCATLMRDLDRVRLPVRAVDIGQDEVAARTVRSLADGNETVPTVVVADRGLVNPSALDVVEAAASADPELLGRLDDRELARLRRGSWWTGLALSLVVALAWFALATSNPTTTYHFAPALVAASWPVARRLNVGRALPASTALVTSLGGGALALLVTAMLVARDALAGPSLVGPEGALAETLLVLVAGAAVGALGAGWSRRTTV